jgi:hypothetical protein
MEKKNTFGLVKSKNACTHSYTLQPSINMAGEVVGPLFLCLKEPGGKISDGKSHFLMNYIVFVAFLSCKKENVQS